MQKNNRSQISSCIQHSAKTHAAKKSKNTGIEFPTQSEIVNGCKKKVAYESSKPKETDTGNIRCNQKR